MNRKLYISNLSWEITSEELERFFNEVGKVVSAFVILNRETGRSRGFGFVEMATHKEARKAMERLNGKSFKGRELAIKEARPENKKPSHNSYEEKMDKYR